MLKEYIFKDLIRPTVKKMQILKCLTASFVFPIAQDASTLFHYGDHRDQEGHPGRGKDHQEVLSSCQAKAEQRASSI